MEPRADLSKKSGGENSGTVPEFSSSRLGIATSFGLLVARDVFDALALAMIMKPPYQLTFRFLNAIHGFVKPSKFLNLFRRLLRIMETHQACQKASVRTKMIPEGSKQLAGGKRSVTTGRLHNGCIGLIASLLLSVPTNRLSDAQWSNDRIYDR